MSVLTICPESNIGRNEYNRKPISMVIGKTRPTIWVDWTGC